ncbi:hypothetical protein COV19_05575 [Candidatus Woesearchaeota archaeon CG10_big_fil_rev_8_21_14_0_10_44_13]|nr:MAG: hypothetical protein COV19_05575 [Candidatus Woesearchaeota archaeon CG10_big_fil_rev_8_21_14_0_10_44_13]
MKVDAKMKKFYLISAIFMFLIASAAAASVTVTYTFRDIQTVQPLANVDSLVYPCLDAGCNILNLATPLPGSGNSGSSSQAAIVYPTNLITPYGYAAYYFAHGFAPQEGVATWHGNGATTFDINFNKIANCKSIINGFNDIITPDADGADVTLRANVQSAFFDPHNYVGYVLPQYAAEFYSSEVQATFRAYDSNNVVVFTQSFPLNIYMDASGSITSDSFALQPGTYRAEIETTVTDNQCSNQLTQLQTVYFTVEQPSPGTLGVDLSANPVSGTEPLDVTFTCSVTNGTQPYSFNFDSDDGQGPSVVLIGASGTNWQQYIVRGYMEGNYNATCTVTDSQGRTGADSAMITVTEQPVVNQPPVVTLVSPPNGTMMTNDDNIVFTYNVTDDSASPLYCTLYTNMSGTFRADISQYTINNTADFFMAFAQDGSYIWNVQCSDGVNSAFAPENWTFTVNTSLPDVPECSDGIDNDADGLVDFPSDPGCVNVTDDDETNQDVCGENLNISSVYMNGERRYNFMNYSLSNAEIAAGYLDFDNFLTNTGDSTILYTNYSIGLFSTTNNTWGYGYTYFLSDIDPHSTILDSRDFNLTDIHDGRYEVFYLAHGIDSNGCSYGDSFRFFLIVNTSQTPLPECSDGIDNDADGLVDFPSDPGCVNATDDDETDTVPCTNHLNITRIDIGTLEIFEGFAYPMNNNYLAMGYLPFDDYFTNTGASTIRNVNYTTMMTNQSGDSFTESSSIVHILPFSTYVEGQDFDIPSTLSEGLYNISVDVEGVDSYGCAQDDQFRFYLIVNRSAPSYECSDSADNDGDTLIDANDPGCYDTGSYNPFDDDENDTLPECSDNFDNDGDNLTDFPSDPGCISISDDNETDVIIIYPECSDGIDNDGDGLIDYPLDPGCVNPIDNNETDGGNQTNEEPFVVLFYPFNGMITNETDLPFMYGVFDDSASWLNCTLYTNISGTFQPEQSLLTLNGFFGTMYGQDIPDGTYIWNVRCSDGVNSAFAPENWTFTITGSTPVYQCNDGVDNDGDSRIDYPNDPGCSDANDDNETDIVTQPQCSDGIDNDGDGLVDMADPDCQNADDNDEGDGSSSGGPNEIPEVLDPEQILYIGHIDIHSTTNSGYEQEIAKAGDEVEITVYIENLASYTLVSLKLSVYIEDLGIWRTIGPFNLAAGEHTTKRVYMDIPDDAVKGEYDVRITVANDDIKRVKYRVVTLV